MLPFEWTPEITKIQDYTKGSFLWEEKVISVMRKKLKP
jgi:hypothetical protein